MYDIGIVGGGLAGLSLAILQAKEGRKVILFEKNSYPFHRVCGEYVSLESWDFVESLGLDLSKLNLPIIKNLIVSSPKGKTLKAKLDLGGFGISRYLLDFELAKIAKNMDVTILENTTVLDIITKSDSENEIVCQNETYLVKTAVGSFGKRSNIDINWKRKFIDKNRTTLNQYVGIKYHLITDFDKETIALHNFKDGYCGISAIENETHCLCYMTTKVNLKAHNNDINEMEENLLKRNPFLKNIFQNSTKLWKNPEVISQISFEQKEQNFNQINLIGDAAGMIAPLCGNGMSMAFHGAYLMHKIILENPEDFNNKYSKEWSNKFSTRLWVGRTIQRFFGNEISTELLISFFRTQPWLLNFLISKTHGKDIIMS